MLQRLRQRGGLSYGNGPHYPETQCTISSNVSISPLCRSLLTPGCGGARRQSDAYVFEPALGAGEQRLRQIALETHHERLALGIAEADVIFEHVDALTVDHQTDEHHTAKRRPARPHSAKRRAHHLVHHARLEGRVEMRHRRECAHPAGVWTAVAV